MESFRKYHKEINEQNKEKVKKDFISDVKKHIQTIAKKYILVVKKKQLTMLLCIFFRSCLL
jgi:DNA anti-recombination protein RmuC